VALGLMLLPFAAKLRKTAYRWRRLAVFILAGAFLAVGLTGCGGNSTVKPQSYSLTITATSGTLTHSVGVTLTVKGA
jgi:hypothetical protein